MTVRTILVCACEPDLCRRLWPVEYRDDRRRVGLVGPSGVIVPPDVETVMVVRPSGRGLPFVVFVDAAAKRHA